MSANESQLPLADFIRVLKDHGFSVGVDTHLQVNQLLNKLGPVSMHGLKLALCPLFATTPEQQEDFYRLFDDHFWEHQADTDHTAPKAEVPETLVETGQALKIPEDPDKPNKRAIYFGIALLAALAIGILWGGRSCSEGGGGDGDDTTTVVEVEKPDFDKDGIPDVDDPDDDNDGIPDSLDCAPKKISKISREGNEDCDPFPNDGTDLCPDRYSLDNSDVDGDGRAPICDNCPGRYNPDQEPDPDCDGLLGKADPCPRDSLNTCDTTIVDDDGDGIPNESDFCPTTADPTNADSDWDLIGDVCDPVDHRSMELLPFIQVPQEEIDPLVVNPDELEQTFFWANNGYAIIGSLLVLLLGAFLAYEIIQWNKRRLFLERERRKGSPYSYTWDLRLPAGFRLFRGETFFQVGKHLRERQQVEANRLHIGKTIQSTIRKGGFPSLVYADATRQPEYLVLIEQHTALDHQTQLFHRLLRELSEQDIHVEVFYYEEDPRLVFRPGVSQRISLEELQERFPNYRLLLFGDGHRLLSINYGGMAAWTEHLLDWKDRCLLTPKPPEQWGYREVELAEHMVVLPATLAGLGTVTEQLQEGTMPELASWVNAAASQQEPDEYSANLVKELEDYLGPKLFQWLCACAVYPDLSWDLFLHLGIRLDRTLMTEANLLKLVRLPWLRNGYLPDELRIALIEKLERANNELIRKTLIELLSKHRPKAGSYVEDTNRMQLIVQQIALGKLSGQELKQAFKALRQMPDSEIERDYTVVKQLEGQYRSPLQFPMPDWCKKLFYRQGMPMLGFKPIARLALVAWATILVSLLFFLIPPKPQFETFRGVQYALSGAKERGVLDAYKGQVYYEEAMAKSKGNILSDNLFDSAYLYLDLAIVEGHPLPFADETTYNLGLVRFQGKRYANMLIGNSSSIWVSPDGRTGWTADGNGFWKLENGTWTIQLTPVDSTTNFSIQDIWMNRKGSYGVAASRDGTIYEYRFGQWKISDFLGEADELFAISMAEDGSSGWVVGANGTAGSYNGYSWGKYLMSSQSDILAVSSYPSGSNAYIATADGQVSLFRASSLFEEDFVFNTSLPVNRPLYGLWMGEVGATGWAVGEEMIQYFEEGAWNSYADSSLYKGVTYTDIWMNKAGTLGWAVSSRGQLIQFRDGTWTKANVTATEPWFSKTTKDPLINLADSGRWKLHFDTTGQIGWLAGPGGLRQVRGTNLTWDRLSSAGQDQWLDWTRQTLISILSDRNPVKTYTYISTTGTRKPSGEYIGEFDQYIDNAELAQSFRFNKAAISYNQGNYEEASNEFAKLQQASEGDSLKMLARYYRLWAIYLQAFEYLDEGWSIRYPGDQKPDIKWTEPGRRGLVSINQMSGRLEEYLILSETMLSDRVQLEEILGEIDFEQTASVICRFNEFYKIGHPADEAPFSRIEALCSGQPLTTDPVETDLKFEIYTYRQLYQGANVVRGSYWESDIRKAFGGLPITRYDSTSNVQKFRNWLSSAQSSCGSFTGNSPKNYVMVPENCESCQQQVDSLLEGVWKKMEVPTPQPCTYLSVATGPVKLFLGDLNFPDITINYRYTIDNGDQNRVYDYLKTGRSNPLFAFTKRTTEEKIEESAVNARSPLIDIFYYASPEMWDKADQLMASLQEKYNQENSSWVDPDLRIRRNSVPPGVTLEPFTIEIIHREAVNILATSEQEFYLDAEVFFQDYVNNGGIYDQEKLDKLYETWNSISAPEDLEDWEYYGFMLSALSGKSVEAYAMISSTQRKITDQQYLTDARLRYFVGYVLTAPDSDSEMWTEGLILFGALYQEPKAQLFRPMIKQLMRGRGLGDPFFADRQVDYGTENVFLGDSMPLDVASLQLIQIGSDQGGRWANFLLKSPLPEGVYEQEIKVFMARDKAFKEGPYTGQVSLQSLIRSAPNPFLSGASIDFKFTQKFDVFGLGNPAEVEYDQRLLSLEMSWGTNGTVSNVSAETLVRNNKLPASEYWEDGWTCRLKGESLLCYTKIGPKSTRVPLDVLSQDAVEYAQGEHIETTLMEYDFEGIRIFKDDWKCSEKKNNCARVHTTQDVKLPHEK